MKTFIVISNDRKFAEFIQGDNFKLLNQIFKDDILYANLLEKELKNRIINYNFSSDIEYYIYPISNYMDLYNNNEMQHENNFISYCFVS